MSIEDTELLRVEQTDLYRLSDTGQEILAHHHGMLQLSSNALISRDMPTNGRGQRLRPAQMSQLHSVGMGRLQARAERVERAGFGPGQTFFKARPGSVITCFASARPTGSARGLSWYLKVDEKTSLYHERCRAATANIFFLIDKTD